jgi:hypothetical protein
MAEPATAAPDDDQALTLARRLADGARRQIDPWPTWPGGWPNDADTALLDAVFSTRARYDTVVRPLLQRWHDSGLSSGALSSLLAAGPDTLTKTLQNRQLVPGRSTNRLTKDAAVLDIASRMVDADLDAANDIKAAAVADPARVRNLIQETPGVGPAQSAYFLMLLGVPGVKADTMVTRWVERALDTGPLTPHQIESLVAAAAELLDVPSTELDHAIWRTESTRRRRR